MSRRIDIDAGEIGPPLDEIIRHIEDGSVHELVIRRDGREVARLSRAGAPAPVLAQPEPSRAYTWDRAREERRPASAGGVFGNLLGLAVLGAGLAFVLAPGYAFFALRSAALSGDVPALADLVDYGEVRASLRSQLSDDPLAQEPEPSWLEDPVGAIRRRLGEAAEEVQGQAPEIDPYLTPPALAAITFGEGRYASERSRDGAPAIARDAEDQPWPGLVHWGPSRTRFRITDDGGSETILTFSREGIFAWKLSHIGLPDGGSPEGAGEAAEGEPQAG
jgi:hypothetical protein